GHVADGRAYAIRLDLSGHDGGRSIASVEVVVRAGDDGAVLNLDDPVTGRGGAGSRRDRAFERPGCAAVLFHQDQRFRVARARRDGDRLAAVSGEILVGERERDRSAAPDDGRGAEATGRRIEQELPVVNVRVRPGGSDATIVGPD